MTNTRAYKNLINFQPHLQCMYNYIYLDETYSKKNVRYGFTCTCVVHPVIWIGVPDTDRPTASLMD